MPDTYIIDNKEWDFPDPEGNDFVDSKLIDKEFTENGTYKGKDEGDGIRGYSQVTINVEGGGGLSWKQINPFNESTVSLYHSTNVTIASSSVDSVGTMEMACDVNANGSYEGFNIQLNNLTKDKTYKLEFDLQFKDASFYNAYGRGYILLDAPKTRYDYYSDWPKNLDANTNVQSEATVFISDGSTIYLSVNISDLVNGSPKFEITNFKLYVLDEANT